MTTEQQLEAANVRIADLERKLEKVLSGAPESAIDEHGLSIRYVSDYYSALLDKCSETAQDYLIQTQRLTAELEERKAQSERDMRALLLRADKIVKLQSEMESMRKNSDRYLWLRNEAQWAEGSAPQVIIWKRDGHHQEICSEEDLDEAVDEAMASGEF